jgi:hypothetical protein
MKKNLLAAVLILGTAGAVLAQASGGNNTPSAGASGVSGSATAGADTGNEMFNGGKGTSGSSSSTEDSTGKGAASANTPPKEYHPPATSPTPGS